MDSPPDLEQGGRGSAQSKKSSSMWSRLSRRNLILLRLSQSWSHSTDETLVEDADTNNSNDQEPQLSTTEAVFIMLKTQAGIGVLGIPRAMRVLGLVPGVIILVLVYGITTWSGYVMGNFWERHQGVRSFQNAGQILCGKWGARIFGTTFSIFWIAIVASGIVGIGDSLVTATGLPSLRNAFLGAAFATVFVGASVPRLKYLARFAYLGAGAIFFAFVLLLVGLSQEHRPAAAPQTGPWHTDYALFNHDATWPERFAAISSILFAFSGPTSYFKPISTLGDVKNYRIALFISQNIALIIYTVIGSVVYVKCGSSVASPVLASAGLQWNKTCSGLAVAGLSISTMLLAHLTARGLYDWFCNDFDLKNIRHCLKWIGFTFATTVIAWIFGNTIPKFEVMLSVIGAVFVPLLAIMAPAWMWWHVNRCVEQRGLQWWLSVVCIAFIVALGVFLMVSGLHGSVTELKSVVASIAGWKPFSSAVNSETT